MYENNNQETEKEEEEVEVIAHFEEGFLLRVEISASLAGKKVFVSPEK